MSRNNLALIGGDATLAEEMARAGRGLVALPSTGAQLANWANSTAPVAATLSNTAAGYSKLGGLWSAAALAGADTDYALFAYQVPAGSRLFVTGIFVSPTIVTGAANATTATILQWGIGINSTAVSLATASTGPDRMPIGVQSCLASLAIGGQIGPAIEQFFPTPLVIEAEKFFHVILTIPVCTATSSEVLRGAVGVNGYFG
jgi:hypothetical protein